MAEGDENRDREDLSEEASPYKLEELRKKGQVSQSKELTGLIGLLGTGFAMYLYGSSMSLEVSGFMKDLFNTDFSILNKPGKETFLLEQVKKAWDTLLAAALPIAAVGFVINALGSYIQVGSVFSTEPLSPDLDRINPIKGFQRLFSLKHIYDGIRLIIRATFVTGVAYLLVKGLIDESPRFEMSDPSILIPEFGRSGFKIFIVLSLALLAFAGLDFWLQRWEYSKNVRLTRKEQKEEHKEHEGDPLIKARIRSVQRELAKRRMMDAVKKADVVITNPTHLAIAIEYKKGKMDAPKVVAKGADFIAQKIKKLATDHRIPMVENVPLARTLFRTVKVGQFIPRSLYQAVAEVLAYVYRLSRRKL